MEINIYRVHDNIRDLGESLNLFHGFVTSSDRKIVCTLHSLLLSLNYANGSALSIHKTEFYFEQFL